MRKLIMLIAVLCIGCASDKKVNPDKIYPIIAGQSLRSIQGLDLTKYSLTTDDFYEDSITLGSIFCFATEDCNVELIVELLKIGADVNYKCEEESYDVITNLAFCNDHGVELTELFLKNGASLDASDAEEDSFLSYAISYDNLKLTEFLINHNAKTNTRDTNEKVGCLPIHGAKSVEMLELLNSKNFDLNGTCRNGKNLLHYLVEKNNAEAINYVLGNDLVDKNEEDLKGETPLDVAKRKKYELCINLLQ